MNAIISLIGVPLGWIMWALYKLVPNYALALLLFTVLTRVLLLPLSIKQQKSMAKMQVFQPRMAEIQKKYANNKEKLNEEMTRLYTEEGYNPMSGCMPMLAQMPILFGLIDVIYKPLKHIVRMPKEMIDAAVEIAKSNGFTNSYASELAVMKANQSDPSMFASLGSEFAEMMGTIDLNLFGIINLADTPTVAFNWLILIPILSGVSALFTGLLSMKQNNNTAGNEAAARSANAMMLFLPIMSLFIAFQVPAGVGIYWIYSNVIGIVQTKLLNKFYNPKEMAEKIRAEAEERRAQLRAEKIEAKKKVKAETATAEDKSAALSEKERRRQKLAEARRRDAEKYGEEYREVTDADLK